VDGLFPQIKPIEGTWTHQDLQELIDKQSDLETFSEIVEHLPTRFEASVGDQAALEEFKDLAHNLSSVIFDKDFESLDKLYVTLQGINLKLVSKE
jgi:hypothetical protein